MAPAVSVGIGIDIDAGHCAALSRPNELTAMLNVYAAQATT